VSGVLLCVLALALAGYSFVEVARFRRSRERRGFPYPAWRLAVRLVQGIVVLALFYFAFRPAGDSACPGWSVTGPLFAALLVLLMLDVIGIRSLYRREQQRRASEFVGQVNALIRKKRVE
jgi:hypothetical protein